MSHPLVGHRLSSRLGGSDAGDAGYVGRDGWLAVDFVARLRISRSHGLQAIHGNPGTRWGGLREGVGKNHSTAFSSSFVSLYASIYMYI